MKDRPYKTSRQHAGEVFAEAQRRGLLGPDPESTWIYMFNDHYGLAHFQHVDKRAWMQMASRDAVTVDDAHPAKGKGETKK